MSKSPIRYPGGKSKHTSKILQYFRSNEKDYREPFVGGGSMFLASGFKNIWINDIDTGVYDLWRMIKEEPDYLVNLINEHTPILEHRRDNKKIKNAINLWKEVKEDTHHKIYPAGYRFLFLIKTCFSGVVTGGPTGGMKQNSNYSITARWSHRGTIKRIRDGCKLLQECKITNLSWEKVLEGADKNTIMFLDPPYLKKGALCYAHSFDMESHINLAEKVTSGNFRYVVTVDDCTELRHLWHKCGIPFERMIPDEWLYSMTASRNKNKMGKELFIVCEESLHLWNRHNKGIFYES